VGLQPHNAVQADRTCIWYTLRVTPFKLRRDIGRQKLVSLGHRVALFAWS